MKNISEQTLEALAAIVKNPEAIEQLPSATRQDLVQLPVETMAELSVRSGELTRDEKKEQAFGKSYQKALKIRDLLRGWGDYGSRDGTSHFSHLFHHVCEVAENYALRLIQGDKNSFLKRKEVLVDFVTELQLKVVEFQTREEIGLNIISSLGILKEALEHEAGTEILKIAIRLASFRQGIEWTNDLMLAPSDKLNEG
jgi:hypothetical protein